MTADTQLLRSQLRQQRQELSAPDAVAAALAIADELSAAPVIRRARRIAIYMPGFGEVDCTLFTERMLDRGKAVFAPILRKKHLLFAPLKPQTELRRNRFGIAEPVCMRRDLCSPAQLDVVITPLVAFDAQLNRLGMGGGYYDRSFAFKKHRKNWARPRMIGVAYSFQRVEQLPVQAWDVPLNAVITEKESYGSY